MADKNQDWLISQGDYSSTGKIAATFPYKYEEFYVSLNGLTDLYGNPVSGLVNATRENRQLSLQWPIMTGISNSTIMCITGIPASYLPKASTNHKSYTTANIIDNSITQMGKVTVDKDGIHFAKLEGGDLTDSGIKGVQACSITYMLVRQDFQ